MTIPLPLIVVLARFGPVTYAHLDGIFAIHEDGALRYHSSHEAWPSTPEARAATIDTQIAAAEAQLAALQRERAGLQPVALLSAPADPEPRPARRRPARVRCLGCNQAIGAAWMGRHCAAQHPGADPEQLRGELVPSDEPPAVGSAAAPAVPVVPEEAPALPGK